MEERESLQGFSEAARPYVCQTEGVRERSGGRRNADDIESKSVGKELRDSLMMALSANGYTRLSVKGTRVNHMGHVYLDY